MWYNCKIRKLSQSFLIVLQILSDDLDCKVEDIVSLELNICDTQPSCLGGANNEFIFSGRLDNLASSFCALRALIDSCESSESLSTEHDIRMIALFDNEEVPFSYKIFVRLLQIEELISSTRVLKIVE